MFLRRNLWTINQTFILFINFPCEVNMKRLIYTLVHEWMEYGVRFIKYELKI